MLVYKTVKQYIQTATHDSGPIYGLAVYRVGVFGIRCHLLVEGISEDAAFVRRLARDCTRGQLDPIHIYDVIIDRLP